MENSPFPYNSLTSSHQKSQKTSRSFHQRSLYDLNYSQNSCHYLCANIFIIFGGCLAHGNKICLFETEETQPKRIQKAYLVLALKTGRKKLKHQSKNILPISLKIKTDLHFPQETTL